MLPLHPSRDYAPEFVTFGGALYRSPVATNLAERADLSTTPPSNIAAASMNEARWHLNGVLLPDGNVMAVGGGTIDNVYAHGVPNQAIMTAELYNPADNTWTLLPEMSVERMYHSSAALLPDGRVLVGGHVPLPQEPTNPLVPQIAETRLEIYEPGYLFRGERPHIAAAPDAVTYGQAFTIEAEYGYPIDSVVLMRPGSTTHAFDSNQRAVVLNVVEQDGTRLTLEAPPDSTVSAPGHHMLFVNGQHAEGAVPSVAHWIHLS